MLGAGKIKPYAAHIDAEHLAHGRHAGAAVTDLLVHRKHDLYIVFGNKSRVVHHLCRSYEAGDACLVVDKAGFEKSRVRYGRFCVKADVIAVFDAERAHVGGALHVLVEPHIHIFGIARA